MTNSTNKFSDDFHAACNASVSTIPPQYSKDHGYPANQTVVDLGSGQYETIKAKDLPSVVEYIGNLHGYSISDEVKPTGLTLDCKNWSDQDLAPLKNLPEKVTYLQLNSPDRLTAGAFEHLPESLTRLDFWAEEVHDWLPRALKKLPNLEELSLSGADVDDYVLEMLKLSSLKKLDLSHCINVTNEGIRHLINNKDGLPLLEEVDLAGTECSTQFQRENASAVGVGAVHDESKAPAAIRGQGKRVR